MVELRRKLSGSHAIAAHRFAKLCEELETKSGGSPSKAVLEEDKAYAIAAVVSSVAFLETSVNEFFGDASDALLSDLDEDAIDRLAAVWRLQDTERLSILDKHQLALVTAGQPPFDLGAQPFQDPHILVRLRNRLVHAKAEWISLPPSLESPATDKLAEALRGKFKENSMLVGSPYPFFPERCLGAGCANWSINTAARFFAEFAKRMGIPRPEARTFDTWRFRYHRNA